MKLAIGKISSEYVEERGGGRYAADDGVLSEPPEGIGAFSLAAFEEVEEMEQGAEMLEAEMQKRLAEARERLAALRCSSVP